MKTAFTKKNIVYFICLLVLHFAVNFWIKNSIGKFSILFSMVIPFLIGIFYKEIRSFIFKLLKV